MSNKQDNRNLLTKDKLDSLVSRVSDTYEDDKGINHLEGIPIPNRNAIINAFKDLEFILFPGFTDLRPVSHANVESMIGDLMYSVYRVLVHEVETSFHYACKMEKCDDCDCRYAAELAVMGLLDKIPEIREVLKTDVASAFNHDPAATSFDEIILAYPGIHAVAMYRLAHVFHELNVPLVPRIINEYAHSNTGIDIHPGATIGKYFFIDHGTGVVIGETTIIGDNVSIYHGVTLGAMGAAKGQEIRGQKRHPTIEDNVVIYPGATIIGGETVVGKNCTIGGNVSLIESVPPYTLVTLNAPELVFLDKKAHKSGAKDNVVQDNPTPRKLGCPARKLCKNIECPSSVKNGGICENC
jgi:serine O-acetyltransferase